MYTKRSSLKLDFSKQTSWEEGRLRTDQRGTLERRFHKGKLDNPFGEATVLPYEPHLSLEAADLNHLKSTPQACSLLVCGCARSLKEFVDPRASTPCLAACGHRCKQQQQQQQQQPQLSTLSRSTARRHSIIS